MTKLDIYWSYRSPYSYLATDRLISIRNDYAVDVDFRVVRPLALREDGFFKRARPQFLPYLMKDMVREGARIGRPITLPNPDPIIMDMATGEVAPDQPHIELLMSLGVAACEAGKGLEFAAAASRRVWGGVEAWHEGDHLAEAAREAGLDLAALDQWRAENADAVKARIAENEAEQMKHHWGVPLMVLDDEDAYFGQDRLEALCWRLDNMGARR
ncbi:MAG: DsbA family protein [Pseudomonadota bacterium]